MIAFLLALTLTACAAETAPKPAPKKPAACAPQVIEKKTKLTFPDGKSIVVDVADTPSTREVGLMCRTKLPKDYGMLFVFPNEMGLGFWMKNTLVSLDLLWLGADKRITAIAPRLKASRVDTPEDKIARAGGRGQFVLELPAGDAARRKLKIGDLLAFEVPPVEK
ncbi:MAG: DUF192 domain-containing protein [Elusimicrobiota bacterium]|nr:DUF192 domain-containing protein [Elusimicrobiota bacterium]